MTNTNAATSTRAATNIGFGAQVAPDADVDVAVDNAVSIQVSVSEVSDFDAAPAARVNVDPAPAIAKPRAKFGLKSALASFAANAQPLVETRAVTDTLMGDYTVLGSGQIAEQVFGLMSKWRQDLSSAVLGDLATARQHKLGLCVDTSASISPLQAMVLMATIAALAQIADCEVCIIVGDDKVRGCWECHAREIREHLAKVHFQQHGGSDFRPLLALAGERGCGATVYFTDLVGETGTSGPANVTWLIPPDGTDGMCANGPGQVMARPPFGRIIRLGDDFADAVNSLVRFG